MLNIINASKAYVCAEINIMYIKVIFCIEIM